MYGRGTLDDPILVNAIFKGPDDTVYQITGPNITINGGTGGTGTGDVSDASNTVKGIAYLSDSASNLDAATGKTAVTPKALQTVQDGIADTVNQIIQEKIENGEISGGEGGGGTTPTEKVTTPTLSIEGAPNNVSRYPTLIGGAFSASLPDTHVASLFQIETAGARSVVWSKSFDSAVTSATVDVGLDASTAYVAKVRYQGQNLGWSNWGSVSFTTKATIMVPPNNIGTPGSLGFGVGICEDADTLAKLGMSAMDGTDDPESDNYGNYITAQKTSNTTTLVPSIFVYIPAFCYSFTDVPENIKEKSPYNAFNVKPFSDFTDEADANTNGYILHRAFIDGGNPQKGFFIGKYLMGGEYTSAKTKIGVAKDLFACCLSKDNGNNKYRGFPSNYTNWSGVACAGITSDALKISKIFGSRFNCSSCFMSSALSMLSFAQGLFATDTSLCAWLDPTGTTNFPKGNNYNGIDINDSSVVYKKKMSERGPQDFLIGATENFAKTTHNGQSNGVADLNGFLLQTTIGILAGATNQTIKMMSETQKFSSMLFDNIQNEDSYEILLGKYIDFFLDSNVYIIWGEPSNSSFYKELNGNKRALCGVFPPKEGSMQGWGDSAGTLEFGNDGIKPADNWALTQVLSTGGHNQYSVNAGIWSRYFLNESEHFGDKNTPGWNLDNLNNGFRPAAY